jgi:hypothetical protein
VNRLTPTRCSSWHFEHDLAELPDSSSRRCAAAASAAGTCDRSPASAAREKKRGRAQQLAFGAHVRAENRQLLREQRAQVDAPWRRSSRRR